MRKLKARQAEWVYRDASCPGGVVSAVRPLVTPGWLGRRNDDRSLPGVCNNLRRVTVSLPWGRWQRNALTDGVFTTA